MDVICEGSSGEETHEPMVMVDGVVGWGGARPASISSYRLSGWEGLNYYLPFGEAVELSLIVIRRRASEWTRSIAG